MIRLVGFVGFVGILLAALPAAPPKVTPPEVSLNGHHFQVPDGFEIELAAGPPLIDRPIVADFDELGRLYVAESSGSNEKVDIQLQKKPHRVVRLEDTNGDGKFDKSTVFADKMMFPEGVMWYAGSLYVAAPPSIWKLTDRDGDGVAEERVEWFQGKTLTGCANDLHGPYLGPDGWIYWAKGAFARQTYDRPGRKPFTTRASHLFRCRPDGSGIEPVMTGGMDNPVDIVFTPGGERLFTTTFFQHPAGGKRDGLIHAVYGGVYGKDHDVVYEHPWTAPTLMPVLTHQGPAAPCGFTRFESARFGPDYQDNLFSCLFNMQKVQRHVLVPDGATFRTQDSDFVVSTNRDFHPTDVLEDADGSLLVVDTGGWYKLCCPTSQLVKPDILGGIYRVRRKQADRPQDPRGQNLDWVKCSNEELQRRLGEDRPAVQRRAIETLAARGEAALPALRKAWDAGNPVVARRNAIWTATRIEGPAARALIVQLGLTDADETVRQSALHSISLHRDPGALEPLIAMLQGPSLHNRRAAAEALGRLQSAKAVPALLAALGNAEDRFLQHSLTYALIEIADREATSAGLAHANPRIRSAALIALDQMEGGNLGAKIVASELNSSDRLMKETATWIVGRHTDWGNDLADYLRGRLSQKNRPAEDREELLDLLARFGAAPAVQEMLAQAAREPSSPESARLALRAMARANLKSAPNSWFEAVTTVLASSDPDTLREALTTARFFPVAKVRPEVFVAALAKIGGDPTRPEAVRLGALAAIPGGLAEVTPEVLAFLKIRLDRERSVAVRSLAADVLSRARLTTAQLIDLAGVLKTTGPMEVARLLEAYRQSTDEKAGLALLAALHEPAGRSGVRSETLKPLLAMYGGAVPKEADRLYAILDADRLKQVNKLEEILPMVKEGDIRRGQAIFNNTKTACAACHTIGYIGGKVGPDLTRIGKIRTERDLLEAIVFPSASFVRSYEPVLIHTSKGKVFNGVLKRDLADEIVLAINANEEVRIPRQDIEEMHPGSVSIMPAGLDQHLSKQDLADLVTFLKACQ